MKELIVHDGIHFVDLRRFRSFRTGNCQLMIERTGFLIFARRGKAGTVPGFVSLVASRLRAVRYFWAGMMGRIGRIGRMVWGGCWVVSWETGKTRVFWKAGEVLPQKARKTE